MQLNKCTLCVLPIVFAFGCTTFNATLDMSTAEITGKVLNRDVYPNLTTITLTIPDYPGCEQVLESPIDEDGKFHFEFQPKTRREVSLSAIEDIVVIAPGNKMHIVKDLRKIDKTTFSGDNAPLNNHISSFRGRYLGRYPLDADQTLIEYKRNCDAEKIRNIEKLNDFVARRQSPKDFQEWAAKQIELDYGLALLNNPYAYTREAWENCVNDRAEYFGCVQAMHDQMDNSLIKTDYFPLSYWLNVYQIIKLSDERTDFPKRIEDSAPIVFNNFLEEGTFSFSRQFAFRSYLEVLISINACNLIDDNREFIERSMRDPFLADNFWRHYQSVKNEASDHNKVDNL